MNMNMSNTDQKHIDRKASKASILRFVDTAVMQERGSRNKRLAMMLSNEETEHKKSLSTSH